MAGAVHEADVANQVVLEAVHGEGVLLGGTGGGVANRPLTSWVIGFVNLGVGVTKLDGDVSF